MASLLSSNYNQAIPTAEEIRRKRIFQKGIQFCMLILGECGLGKSTFVNNLSNRVVFDSDYSFDSENAHLEPGFEFFQKQIQLVETNSTPINLDLVLVPGLGDNINNSAIPDRINDYLEKQFEIVLNEENRINRQTKLLDTRPHVCLYFIRPTSRGLNEFDVMLMKKICDKVNLLPVISKCDMLTKEELVLNKKLITKDLKDNNIHVYEFGEYKLSDIMSPEFYLHENKEQEKVLHQPEINASYNYSYNSDTKIADLVPFSIVCSNEKNSDPDTGSGNFDTHVRRYLWGSLVVEDSKSSDFIFLKNIILGSHLQDFKDVTHNVLYENYRRKKLMEQDGTLRNVDQSYDISNLKGLMKSLGEDIENSLISPYSSKNKVNAASSEALTRELEEKEKLILSYQKKLSDLKNMLQLSSQLDI